MFPEPTPWTVAAAALALHALAITCATWADRSPRPIVWAALLVSAALAAINGYLLTLIYL